jgi:hypothetical protein
VTKLRIRLRDQDERVYDDVDVSGGLRLEWADGGASLSLLDLLSIAADGAPERSTTV